MQAQSSHAPLNLAIADAGQLRRHCTFNLHGCETYPLAFLQDVVLWDRLAVDADQVVLRLGAGNHLAKELLDGRAGIHVHVVREAAAVVVDHQEFHERLLKIEEMNEEEVRIRMET
ncbi:MAG: hypothetical protein WCI73_16845 [Phycisphaerae bacterium]